MTTRAAIYARISDDREGEALGVARQVEDARARATVLGLDIVEPPFVDNDISASTRSTKRRPAYDDMLAGARAGDFSTIIAYSNSRMTRRPRELEDLIVLYERYGVVVRTVVSGDDDLSTADGRMTARIKASVDAAEAERVSERVTRKNDQRAASGAPHGRIGYGFQRVDDRDIAEPDEADVVREMTRRVLGGESLRALAAEMNTRGLRSRTGAAWTGPTLRRMLRRPSLAGMRVHRGQVVGRSDGESIISDDEHAQLVALFTDPARKPTRERGGRLPAHLLSSLCVCGRPEPTADDPDAICGGKMRRIPRSGPNSAAYQCGVCMRVRRAQVAVDEYVTEVILRRLERDDAADLFVEHGDAGDAREAREKLAGVTARLASAADMFAAGTIDATQLARITTALRGERESLDAQLVRNLPPAIPLDAVGPGARDWWASANLDQRRALISSLARVVVLPVGAGRRTFDPTSVRIEWLSEDT
jgi:DNA invertase Pin-like site-specific DNA recombinase